MPVEPVTNAARDCEQVAEDLVAPDRWIRDDERMPFAAEHRSRKIDRPADRSDLRRRVEGRADFVMCNGSIERCHGLKDLGADASPSSRATVIGQCLRSQCLDILQTPQVAPRSGYQEREPSGGRRRSAPP